MQMARGAQQQQQPKPCADARFGRGMAGNRSLSYMPYEKPVKQTAEEARIRRRNYMRDKRQTEAKLLVEREEQVNLLGNESARLQKILEQMRAEASVLRGAALLRLVPSESLGIIL